MKKKKTARRQSRATEFEKREDYRIAFVKRNVKKWNELRERHKARDKTDNEIEIWKQISSFVKEFEKYFPAGWIDCLYDGVDLHKVEWGTNPLSIRLFQDEDYSCLHLETIGDNLNSILSVRKANLEKSGRASPQLAIDAVELNESTIPIEIRLDRKKEDIIRDVGLLIDVLHHEAVRLGIELGHPKKPQWDVYDRYLQVYDLKTANPKMEWSEIAKWVFPDEVDKGRKPLHRKVRKEELATDSAVNKVYRYWKEANRMIHKGGWKQI